MQIPDFVIEWWRNHGLNHDDETSFAVTADLPAYATHMPVKVTQILGGKNWSVALLRFGEVEET